MDETVRIAKDVIEAEIDGLRRLQETLGPAFVAATDLLAGVEGRIVVTGMGKSGHVGRKIAATFASTGAPSLFVHPGEASHGDLGMIARDDAILALSKSGETAELRDVISHAARFSTPICAITADAASSLGAAATVVLVLPDAQEACDETRAPTTSTTMMMAMGDALAVALLRRKGFSADDFRGFHPGGSLGAALRKVADLMRGPDAAPLVPENARLAEAVRTLNAGGLGCVGVVAPDGVLVGMLTDGDLRRGFARFDGSEPVGSVMTRDPRTIAPDALAGEALALLSDHKITALFVVENAKPVGLVHVHDCLTTGVL
ncbi:MAG: KpsF/GutQ family sugar-phosphate isomerase [Pseudomonadota bacterium]